MRSLVSLVMANTICHEPPRTPRARQSLAAFAWVLLLGACAQTPATAFSDSPVAEPDSGESDPDAVTEISDPGALALESDWVWRDCGLGRCGYRRAEHEAAEAPESELGVFLAPLAPDGSAARVVLLVRDDSARRWLGPVRSWFQSLSTDVQVLEQNEARPKGEKCATAALGNDILEAIEEATLAAEAGLEAGFWQSFRPSCLRKPDVAADNAETSEQTRHE